MKKVVSYIETVSNSLLAVADTLESPIFTDEGLLYIDLKNKSVKNTLKEQIVSNLNAEREFGKDIIVVNACFPADNWRLKNTDQTEEYKYSFTGTVSADKQLLQHELDSLWESLKTGDKLHESFKLIDHPKLDTRDVTEAIKAYVGVNVIEKKKSEFTLKDSNSSITKDCSIRHAPSIMQEMEVCLVAKKLITPRF